MELILWLSQHRFLNHIRVLGGEERKNGIIIL